MGDAEPRSLLADLPASAPGLRFLAVEASTAGLVWLAKRRLRVELKRFFTWLSVLRARRGGDKKGQPLT